MTLNLRSGMITIEYCNVCIQIPQADKSGLSTIEKMYYMARGLAVDLVEGKDGVWRERVVRDRLKYEYGHLADCFDYFLSEKYGYTNYGYVNRMPGVPRVDFPHD